MTVDYLNFVRYKSTLILGDCREVLKTMPDESVDMVMTSPPYFGLRKYKAEPVIFDAVDGCAHEWGEYEQTFHSGTNAGEKQLTVKGAFHNTQKEKSNFCRLCGAWRGMLGSEPNPDFYIKHLCDIIDQVKRVLKATGTAYINLDDSYQSSSSKQCEPSHGKSDTIPQDCPLNDSIWNHPCDGCQAASVLRTLHKDHVASPELADGLSSPNPKHKVNQSDHLPNDRSLRQNLPLKSSLEFQRKSAKLAGEHPHASQESMPPLSSGQLRGECSPTVYSSSDRSKADSSFPYVVESLDGNNGNGVTSSKLVYHKSDKVCVDNALFSSCPYYNTDALLTYMLPPAKSLIGIPERFVLEMLNRGWIRRNTIIWHKNNVMPESAKDRFTIDFEYVYMFSKSNRYFFDRQFEPYASQPNHKLRNKAQEKYEGTNLFSDGGRDYYSNGQRNKRSVWTINPRGFKGKMFDFENADFIGDDGKPYKLHKDCPIHSLGMKMHSMNCKCRLSLISHYATYPEELCRTPIEASCPEFICTKCGRARVKVYDIEPMKIKRSGRAEESGICILSSGTMESPPIIKSVGLSDCGCGAPFRPGVVLDPFSGVGTTCVMAKKLGRNYLGIEISQKYHELAQRRLEATDARMI